MTLVGLLVFFGEGSMVQLTTGLMICVLCQIAYHNLKPYDTWTNDLLQQACQLTIFITLLSSVIKAGNQKAQDENADNFGGAMDRSFNDAVLGQMLVVFTILSTLMAAGVSVLEVYPDPWGTVFRGKLRVKRIGRRGVAKTKAVAVKMGPPLQRVETRLRMSVNAGKHALGRLSSRNTMSDDDDQNTGPLALTDASAKEATAKLKDSFSASNEQV